MAYFKFSSLLFLVIALILIPAATSYKKQDKSNEHTHKTLRIHKFMNCVQQPNLPCRMTRVKIYQPVANVHAVDADGICEKPTKSIEKIIVNISKCSNRKVKDCQRLHNLSWKGGQVICPLLVADQMPWSSVFKAFSPRIRCSNEKGNFTIRNLIPDVKDLEQMYFGGSEYWLVQTKLFDETQQVWFCFYSEGDFPNVRG